MGRLERAEKPSLTPMIELSNGSLNLLTTPRWGLFLEVYMTKMGIIRSFVDGQVLVEVVDEEKLESSACKPSSCGSCESCGKQKVDLADLPDSDLKNELKQGLWVEVLADNTKYTIAVLVTFVLPIIMLLIGIWLGQGNEIKSLLLGGLLFAFSLIFAYIFDKSFKAKVKITKVIERND
jgi:positive regulator of sigma E activity